MTALLALTAFVALAAAVVVLVRRHDGEAAPRTFESAAEEPERAPATYVALGRIQSLLRALPDDAAERELAAMTGGEDALQEALR